MGGIIKEAYSGIIKETYSLKAFCVYSGVNYNLKEQYQLNDSVYGSYDIPCGNCLVDTTTSVPLLTTTLKYQTSQLGVRLKNETGKHLQIQQVTLAMVDNSEPFYYRPVEYLSLGEYVSKCSSLSLRSSEKILAKNDTFVANFSMLLTDEKALDGKAVRYIIETDRGVYIYTKPGKTYLRGHRYMEELTITGK